MNRDLPYWERRIHNLEETILTENDYDRLEEELVNYIECLIQATLQIEIEESTYHLN